VHYLEAQDVLVKLESFVPIFIRACGVVVFFPLDIIARSALVIALVCLSAPFAETAEGFWLYMQFFVGLGVGCSVLLIREGARALGALLDTARGQTIGSILNPLSSEMVSPLSGAVEEAVWYYVVIEGMIPVLFYLFLQSFTLVPINGSSIASFSFIGNSLLDTSYLVSAEIFPILTCFMVALLLGDVFFLVFVAVWKLEAFSNYQNSQRSVIVLAGLLALLYCGVNDNLERVLYNISRLH
jgi:type III secretory pathway component EscT